MTTTLDRIGHLLNELPLGRRHRALVFEAWEAAPETEPDTSGDRYNAYLHSEAGKLWTRVRDFKLRDPEGNGYYSTTLEEMARYNGVPTKENIIEALDRAHHILNGAHA